MYILMSSEANATLLSEKVWNISRPPICRDPEDVTTQYTPPIVHPEGGSYPQLAGEVRLMLMGAPLYISPKADPHELDPLIQPFVDSGDVPEADLIAIQETIRDNRGKQIPDVAAVVPAYWQATAKDYDTMLTEEYFGIPE